MITRRVETRRVQLPQEEWVEEPSYYILRLSLPHVFKKEDLNIMYDPSGKITIRGIKQLNTNRFVRFDSSYNIPKDSNFEKISGILENNILSFTIPKIIHFKPSDEKKEELLIEEEKPKMAVEERKEEEELKVPKEKPKMAEEEKKEEEPLLKEKAKIVTEEKPKMAEEEKKNGAVMKDMNKLNGKLQTIKEQILEERKDKTVLDEMKEKPKIVTEKKKEEEALTVPQEKPKMVEEEKKDGAVMREMKEESMKEKMAMRERIKEEGVDLNKLNSKLQTIKEPNLEETKDKTVMDEIKKEEPTMNEKPKTFKDKDEEIHKDKPNCYDDMEKKEDSIKKEDAEREIQQKKPKKKESKKRRWIWNEEDKGWLDWMDSAFIDDVFKKVCRNKRFITLALVAFSTGFYFSRKLRKKGWLISCIYSGIEPT